MVKALYSDQKNENMYPSDKSELPLKGVWHRGVPGIEEGHAGKIQLVWERLIVSWMLEEVDEERGGYSGFLSLGCPCNLAPEGEENRWIVRAVGNWCN